MCIVDWNSVDKRTMEEEKTEPSGSVTVDKSGQQVPFSPKTTGVSLPATLDRLITTSCL